MIKILKWIASLFKKQKRYNNFDHHHEDWLDEGYLGTEEWQEWLKNQN